MTVATAQACANLAFVKYWGKRDASLNLPLNNSISMTLDGARTTTTVRFSAGLARDTVTLAGSNAVPAFATRVSAHLDRIRTLAGVSTRAQVDTYNNFPSGTGFASSASGFAALTLAATHALGLSLAGKRAIHFGASWVGLCLSLDTGGLRRVGLPALTARAPSPRSWHRRSTGRWSTVAVLVTQSGRRMCLPAPVICW